MISEFIWLDLVERTEGGFRCSCSLPDPDPYSDDNMIICGDVVCIYDTDTESATVNIKLFDNFRALCIGDSYQRKNFLQTIIFVINMKYGVDFQNAHINLSDCWGMYSGDLVSIDEIIRGVD